MNEVEYSCEITIEVIYITFRFENVRNSFYFCYQNGSPRRRTALKRKIASLVRIRFALLGLPRSIKLPPLRIRERLSSWRWRPWVRRNSPKRRWTQRNMRDLEYFAEVLRLSKHSCNPNASRKASWKCGSTVNAKEINFSALNFCNLNVAVRKIKNAN